MDCPLQAMGVRRPEAFSSVLTVLRKLESGTLGVLNAVVWGLRDQMKSKHCVMH